MEKKPRLGSDPLEWIKDTLEQYEETLRTWKDLHFKVINFYRGQAEQMEQGQKKLF